MKKQAGKSTASAPPSKMRTKPAVTSNKASSKASASSTKSRGSKGCD